MHDYSFQAMGTDCRVLLDGVDEDRAATAAEAAIDEVERLEQKYSRYRADSTLSRINRACGAGGAVVLDVETAFLLDYAARARDLSDGAFDVTSGILRHVWRDGADRTTVEADLARLMPRVGFDKLQRSGYALRFSVATSPWSARRPMDGPGRSNRRHLPVGRHRSGRSGSKPAAWRPTATTSGGRWSAEDAAATFSTREPVGQPPAPRRSP